jgi:hypothetical protein
MGGLYRTPLDPVYLDRIRLPRFHRMPLVRLYLRRRLHIRLYRRKFR